MNRLKFLLKIKPWILFIIFFSTILMGWNEFYSAYISPFIFLLWFCWIISIGYYGQDLIDKSQIRSLSKRKFAIYTYLFTISLFLTQTLKSIVPQLFDLTNPTPTAILTVVVTTFSVMIPLFYLVGVASIVITTIEHNRSINFGGSLGNFLRLLMFPLGVISVQATLNKKVNVRS